MKDSLSISDTALIRKTFKLLNSEIAALEETTHYIWVISNCIDLLDAICKEKDFNEEGRGLNAERVMEVPKVCEVIKESWRKV